MTCLVAYKDADGVVLGTDSQATSGDSAVMVASPKWVKYDNFVIAACGVAAIETMLDALRYEPEFNQLPSRTLKDIYVIVKTLRAYMKEEQYASGEAGILAFQGEWILATKNKIYWICSAFGVYECPKFHCLGSGADIAYGAMDTLNSLLPDMEGREKVKRCIETAIKRSVSCGGNVVVKAYKELK